MQSRIRIFVRLPNGTNVPHGHLEYGVFTRHVGTDGREIKWADIDGTLKVCFSINSLAIPNLRKKDCEIVQFIWNKKTERVYYRLSLDEFCSYPEITLPTGEKNIRVPIEAFRIYKRQAKANSASQIPVPAQLENPQLKFIWKK